MKNKIIYSLIGIQLIFTACQEIQPLDNTMSETQVSLHKTTQESQVVFEFIRDSSDYGLDDNNSVETEKTQNGLNETIAQPWQEIELYMWRIVPYFHDIYEQGESLAEHHVGYFCAATCIFDSSGTFIKNGVVHNEESGMAMVPRHTILETASCLFGDSVWDQESELFSSENPPEYDKDTDSYLFKTNTDYWYSEPYIPVTSTMTVTKDNNDILVSVAVVNYMLDEEEPSRAIQLAYRFKEIINYNTVFYQLVSIEKGA